MEQFKITEARSFGFVTKITIFTYFSKIDERNDMYRASVPRLTEPLLTTVNRIP